MNKKATIKDIARSARVSATAVSLALNNRPRIGAETRERILRIAKELNYRPNLAARSLVSRQTQTIGLIITTITNPFYAELAKGIEDKAFELGYSIIFCSTNEDVKLEEFHVNNLRGKGVDGIIFSSVKNDDPNLLPLLEDQFPFILVNRRIHDPALKKRIDYVVLDNYAGAFQIMDHLYGLGHRRIGILAGAMDTSTATERTEGAKKFLKERECRWDPALFAVCHYSKERAYHATQKFIGMKLPPTAIFAENDYMALGARDAILDAGWKIPEDMALVGFDDIGETALKGVEITTVSQKRYEMGALAVKVLVEKIKEGSPRMANQIILQPELIIRKSCGEGQPTRDEYKPRREVRSLKTSV
jgi:LacI family transcriptional regulator